jgi:RNA polymerase sigma factor (sigma-70 family)
MAARASAGAATGAESDERLMGRVQRGEVRAFETLFARYRGRLFGFLVGRVSNAAAAEDLLQETWLRVVRGREGYDPKRRFSTWLFQIANNLCRDRARRLEVDARRVLGALEQLENDPGPSDSRRVELRIDVARRLEVLPDRLREVLVLRYQRDLGEREVAELLGIPVGTVKSRLHHALRALREHEEAADE